MTIILTCLFWLGIVLVKEGILGSHEVQEHCEQLSRYERAKIIDDSYQTLLLGLCLTVVFVLFFIITN